MPLRVRGGIKMAFLLVLLLTTLSYADEPINRLATDVQVSDINPNSYEKVNNKTIKITQNKKIETTVSLENLLKKKDDLIKILAQVDVDKQKFEAQLAEINGYINEAKKVGVE